MIVLNVPVPKIEEEWGYYQYLNRCLEFSQKDKCCFNLHCSITKLLIIKPNYSTEYVAHEGHEETIYVLNGTGEVTLCDITIPLPTGMCIEVGCLDKHSIKNIGRGDLEVLEIWVPAGKCILSEDDILN